MNSLIAAFKDAFSQLRKTYLDQVMATVLAGCLLLTTGVNAAPSSQELGRAVRQRVEQTDKTERPKTTGDFLNEARGDVPLDVRVENITRDSIEAFKKLGEEYTPDLGQAARDLKDEAGSITK